MTNPYIARTAPWGEIICSWEYFRRTIIHNPRTFILRLQSQDRTRGSSSGVYTAFSKESKHENECQTVHLSSQAESVRFQKGISLGQEGGWFLPWTSAGGLRHLEGASGICKGKVEIHQRCCMLQSMVAKNIHSSKHWKLPKKLRKKNLAFSIDKTKISSQNGISSYSVFRQTALLRCTSSQFLPTLLMLIHHSWAFGKQKREEEQTQYGTSWEESVFAMVLHQSWFRTVSTQRFLGCLQTVTRCPVPYPHFYKRKNSVEEKNKTKQKKSLSHAIAPGAPTLMP